MILRDNYKKIFKFRFILVLIRTIYRKQKVILN